MNINPYPKAVVCVANVGNEVSLQLWKIYKTVRDSEAYSEGLIRVVDEEGEDYLFPEENFVPIELPRDIKASFERAVRRQRVSMKTSRVSASVKRARTASTARKSKGRSSSGA